MNHMANNYDLCLAFLLTRGPESWVRNYLEQLDEIPKIKHFNIHIVTELSSSFEIQYVEFPEVIERVVVVVQVLLQGAGHRNDCLA